MDAELLALLACPRCKISLTLLQSESGLLCESCSLVYPIIENIPVLLEEEAIPQDEWERMGAALHISKCLIPAEKK